MIFEVKLLLSDDKLDWNTIVSNVREIINCQDTVSDIRMNGIELKRIEE